MGPCQRSSVKGGHTCYISLYKQFLVVVGWGQFCSVRNTSYTFLVFLYSNKETEKVLYMASIALLN